MSPRALLEQLLLQLPREFVLHGAQTGSAAGGAPQGSPPLLRAPPSVTLQPSADKARSQRVVEKFPTETHISCDQNGDAERVMSAVYGCGGLQMGDLRRCSRAQAGRAALDPVSQHHVASKLPVCRATQGSLASIDARRCVDVDQAFQCVVAPGGSASGWPARTMAEAASGLGSATSTRL